MTGKPLKPYVLIHDTAVVCDFLTQEDLLDYVHRNPKINSNNSYVLIASETYDLDVTRDVRMIKVRS